MRTGIIILCRYDSKRLPGKILESIHGKALLDHIIDRLLGVSSSHQIIVATSDDKSDDRIRYHCDGRKIPCFRGSKTDVAERFLACAETFELDFSVRINGDNLFADPDIIHHMIGLLKKDDYDFISNVPGRTFPFGMSVEILKTSFYASIFDKMNTENYREHVTLYLYDHEELGKRKYFYNSICPGLKGMNLAIDNAEDIVLAEKIMTRLSPEYGIIGLKELCEIKDYIIHERMAR